MNFTETTEIKQKIKRVYISIANYVSIYFISVILFTNIIALVFSSASNIICGNSLELSSSTIFDYVESNSLSEIDSLIYISFAISIFISFISASKFSYILKFNSHKYQILNKILIMLFTVLFTLLFLLLVGSVFLSNILAMIYTPIAVFFINFAKYIVPSLFMFNGLIGIK